MVRAVPAFSFVLSPYTPPRLSKAHTIRAFLFATATAVRFHPRRSSTPRIHRLRLSVFVLAQRRVARAPWSSSLRRYLSPRFLIPNKRVCPPVECCLGTKPHHAAHCRPLVKPPTSPPAAISAVAVIGPTPGIVNRR